jgi:cellulose synthase/poly-beta-1,6-N-acetylglucosamine synthase-like glycosyltransferase
MGLLSAAFVILYFNTTKIKKVSDPKDKSHIGVGAFNLVKRSAFEKTAGFPWLRMEVIDDSGLGLMLKRSGFRTFVLNGLETVEMNWYPNLWEMIKGLEKNLFPALGHYSYQRAFIRALIILGTGFAPLAASAYTGSWSLGIATLLFQFAIPGVLSLLVRKQTKQNAFVGFLIPFGYLLLVFALIRSTYFHWLRKGIEWRGTRYSTLELKRGSRVRL